VTETNLPSLSIFGGLQSTGDVGKAMIGFQLIATRRPKLASQSNGNILDEEVNKYFLLSIN